MYFSPDYHTSKYSALFFWCCGYGLLMAAMHANASCSSTNNALQCENVRGVRQDTNVMAIYLENTTLNTGDLDNFHRLRVVHMNQCGGNLTELLGRVSRQLTDLRITFSQATYSFPQILDYGFPQLVQLCLAGNRLTTVTNDLLKNLEKLEKLSLDGNEITEIEDDAMQNIPLLRILNISQNNLTTLQKPVFKNMNQLQILDLSSNKITTIEEGTFEGLAALMSLNLAYNEIVTLQNGVFLGLEPSKSIPLNNRMLQIDLSNNKVMNVEWGSLNGIAERLAYLDLRENALGIDFHFQHLPMEKGACEVCQTDCAKPIRVETHGAPCDSAVALTALWRAFAELRMQENPLLLSGNPICSERLGAFCGACNRAEIISGKATVPAAVQWNLTCIMNYCLPHQRRRLFLLEACAKVTAEFPMTLRVEQSFNDSELRESNTTEETPERLLMAGLTDYVGILLVLISCIVIVAIYAITRNKVWPFYNKGPELVIAPYDLVLVNSTTSEDENEECPESQCP